jgi:hypothetical protein
VPRERATGAIATSHRGASSAIPSFPEPTGRLGAAAHTAAGTTHRPQPAVTGLVYVLAIVAAAIAGGAAVALIGIAASR